MDSLLMNPDPNYRRLREDTPLILACMHREEDRAMEILENPQECDIHALNIDNDNALMIACHFKLSRVAERIIDLLRDKIDYSVVDNDGDTVLTIACRNGLRQIAKKILRYSTPEQCRLWQKDMDGDTSLMLACKANMERVAMEIASHTEYADLDAENELGQSAIQFAYERSMVSVVSVFVDRFNSYTDALNSSIYSNPCGDTGHESDDSISL